MGRLVRMDEENVFRGRSSPAVIPWYETVLVFCIAYISIVPLLVICYIVIGFGMVYYFFKKGFVKIIMKDDRTVWN